MSRSYSDEFIEQVRYSNDIVDVIADYVNLEVAGKSYKGLCPFHDEKTASFNVNSEKQLYYCFGCGAGGNVFNFMMEIEGLTFVEVVESLAKRANLELPQEMNTPEMKKKRSEKQKLLEIHSLTFRFYNYLLLEYSGGERGLEYLKGRDFGSEIIDKFKLGFAPDRWEGLYQFLKDKGYRDDILAKSGLVLPRKKAGGYYDRFRNRIIFSICNHRGQVIGFGGRILEDSNQPKYLNSPQTVLFDKSKNLYALNWAKKSIQKKEEAIIVEGYTDVLRAHQYGITNVVASLGTSLTNGQAKLIKRYAKRVYIAYDADTAGAKATLRGLDILKKEGLNVKVIKLSSNQDPDDFIKANGKDAFIKLKDEGIPLVQFKINTVLQNHEFSTVNDKVEVVEKIIPVLAQIRSRVELEEYFKAVAKKLNIEKEILIDELKNYIKGGKQHRKFNSRNNKSVPSVNERLNDSGLELHLKTVDELLRNIIKNPSLIERLEDRLTPNYFIKEEYQKLIVILFDSYKGNKKLNVDRLLEQIEEDKVKRLLLKLTINEDNSLNYTEEMVCEENYIKKIKEYQQVMKKENLESEIKKAEKNRDYDRVSKLQKEYQDLLGGEGE